MNSGGINVKKRIRDTVRFTGLLMPLLFVLYGYVATGSDATLSSDNTYLFSLIMTPWVLLGILIFISPSKQPRELLLRLAAYHVCAGAYVLFIAGFTTPFITLAWVLLLLISYIYLSDRGLALNISTLLFVVTASMIFHTGSSELRLLDIVSTVFILVIGTIIILLTRTGKDDSDELRLSKAKESLQRNRINALINNLADAIISIDDKGVIDVYNAASLNLLNTNISLDGQKIDEVLKIHGQLGEQVSLLEMAQTSRGMSMRDDLSLEIGDETIRLEVTASPVRSSYNSADGSSAPSGYVLILRDVTKTKSLEEERDEFISVVSHELRTPITIAEGTISNVKLMAERGNVPPGTLERSLSDAHEQIIFLSRMVNDLSTLSRAERGVADEAEEIDVKNMLNSLFGEYSPQAQKKQLHFDLDIVGKLGIVTASPLYLRELLQNFITNAIKYTKEGSITLRAERTGQDIRFEVKDTGIGISKGDQAKIFKKFYRSEDYRTRETGGTGLGLYVASKLARKLGTTIDIKSRLNHGSIFSFTMPVDEKAAPEQATQDEGPEQSKPLQLR